MGGRKRAAAAEKEQAPEIDMRPPNVKRVVKGMRLHQNDGVWLRQYLAMYPDGKEEWMFQDQFSFYERAEGALNEYHLSIGEERLRDAVMECYSRNNSSQAEAAARPRRPMVLPTTTRRGQPLPPRDYDESPTSSRDGSEEPPEDPVGLPNGHVEEDEEDVNQEGGEESEDDSDDNEPQEDVRSLQNGTALNGASMPLINKIINAKCINGSMQFKVTFKNGAEPQWVPRTSLREDLIDEWQDVVSDGSGSDEEDEPVSPAARDLEPQDHVAQAKALVAQVLMGYNQMTQNPTYSDVDALAKIQSLMAQANQAHALALAQAQAHQARLQARIPPVPAHIPSVSAQTSSALAQAPLPQAHQTIRPDQESTSQAPTSKKTPEVLDDSKIVSVTDVRMNPRIGHGVVEFEVEYDGHEGKKWKQLTRGANTPAVAEFLKVEKNREKYERAYEELELYFQTGPEDLETMRNLAEDKEDDELDFSSDESQDEPQSSSSTRRHVEEPEDLLDESSGGPPDEDKIVSVTDVRFNPITMKVEFEMELVGHEGKVWKPHTVFDKGAHTPAIASFLDAPGNFEKYDKAEEDRADYETYLKKQENRPRIPDQEDVSVQYVIQAAQDQDQNDSSPRGPVEDDDSDLDYDLYYGQGDVEDTEDEPEEPRPPPRKRVRFQLDDDMVEKARESPTQVNRDASKSPEPVRVAPRYSGNLSEASDEGSLSSGAEFTINEVVDVQFNRSKRRVEFQVNWVGYDVTDNTWRPVDSFTGGMENPALKKFLSNTENQEKHRIAVELAKTSKKGSYYHLEAVQDVHFNEQSNQVEFEAKWIGYTKTSWLPISNFVGEIRNECIITFFLVESNRLKFFDAERSYYEKNQLETDASVMGVRACETLKRLEFRVRETDALGRPSVYWRPLTAFDFGLEENPKLRKYQITKKLRTQLRIAQRKVDQLLGVYVPRHKEKGGRRKRRGGAHKKTARSGAETDVTEASSQNDDSGSDNDDAGPPAPPRGPPSGSDHHEDNYDYHGSSTETQHRNQADPQSSGSHGTPGQSRDQPESSKNPSQQKNNSGPTVQPKKRNSKPEVARCRFEGGSRPDFSRGAQNTDQESDIDHQEGTSSGRFTRRAYRQKPLAYDEAPRNRQEEDRILRYVLELSMKEAQARARDQRAEIKAKAQADAQAQAQAQTQDRIQAKTRASDEIQAQAQEQSQAQNFMANDLEELDQAETQAQAQARLQGQAAALAFQQAQAKKAQAQAEARAQAEAQARLQAQAQAEAQKQADAQAKEAEAEDKSLSEYGEQVRAFQAQELARMGVKLPSRQSEQEAEATKKTHQEKLALLRAHAQAQKEAEAAALAQARLQAQKDAEVQARLEALAQDRLRAQEEDYANLADPSDDDEDVYEIGGYNDRRQNREEAGPPPYKRRRLEETLKVEEPFEELDKVIPAHLSRRVECINSFMGALQNGNHLDGLQVILNRSNWE